MTRFASSYRKRSQGDGKDGIDGRARGHHDGDTSVDAAIAGVFPRGSNKRINGRTNRVAETKFGGIGVGSTSGYLPNRASVPDFYSAGSARFEQIFKQSIV